MFQGLFNKGDAEMGCFFLDDVQIKKMRIKGRVSAYSNHSFVKLTHEVIKIVSHHEAEIRTC